MEVSKFASLLAVWRDALSHHHYLHVATSVGRELVAPQCNAFLSNRGKNLGPQGEHKCFPLPGPTRTAPIDPPPTTSGQPGTGRSFPHRAARRPLQPDRRTSILRPSNGFYVRPGARSSRVCSTPATATPHPGTPIPLRGSAVSRWGLRDCDGGPRPLQGSPVGAGRRSRLGPQSRAANSSPQTPACLCTSNPTCQPGPGPGLCILGPDHSPAQTDRARRRPSPRASQPEGGVAERALLKQPVADWLPSHLPAR